MSPILILTFVALFFVALGLFLFLQRTNAREGFKLLQDSFESLQRNLVLHQTEFEKTQEIKSSALKSEISQELRANRVEMQQGLLQASQALETKVTGMDGHLNQKLSELTVGVQNKLELNIKEGFLHFEKVQEHLRLAEKQLQNLNLVGQSIHDLNNLLKLPHLRGGFGEASLERLLSDLLPVECFELQYRIVPTSTERVDAVVKCPQYVIPIDSKFPREQVLALFDAQDPTQMEHARKTLVEVMRTLAKQISEKYIHPEHGTSDMALLFVPSETLYFEILRNPKVGEELSKLKVFPVSPNTLAVTLHAISISRSYYEMAKGVEKTISNIKKSQQHFENFERRFEDVGKGLGKAQDAFNIASTHLTRYSGSVLRLAGEEDTANAAPTLPRLDTLPPSN